MELKDCVLNAPERSEYAEVLSALEKLLDNLPHKVVIIDGKPGVGKTTLGRFLAWRFNISLIETDLYLISQQGEYSYRDTEVASVIRSRNQSDRPVIVEGVVALRLLDKLDINWDYHIHVTCEQSTSYPLNEYQDYLKEYKPAEKANLVISLPHSIISVVTLWSAMGMFLHYVSDLKSLHLGRSRREAVVAQNRTLAYFHISPKSGH